MGRNALSGSRANNPGVGIRCRCTLILVSRAAKIATGIGAAVVVAGLVALAYPAFAAIRSFEQGVSRAATETESTSAPVADPTTSPSPTPSPTSSAGGCASEASLLFESQGDAPVIPKLINPEAMRDNGSRPGARGEVVWHGDEMFAYIVVPNDNLISIDERLCFDFTSLRFFNHVLSNAIQPGAQLILRPDPTIPFIHPYAPFDAVAGTNTVEYNSTIYEIGAAVRTHDLDAARALWAKALSGHVSPQAQAAATKALDDGDWPTLEQLFP
ncbi:hypothetical protein JCM13591A_33140 [Microbacterium xylanilyticum]